MDYTDYPAFRASIGFTQRGCRMSCHFCDVPNAEGKVQENATIADIWRGPPWPRHLLLLDNDFFGQPHWRDRIREIREGKFAVCFNQGINARMLSDEAAEAIASVNYQDDGFKRRGIYTAWDSLGDEGPLFRGLNALVRYGVAPSSITVYMLLENPTISAADLYRHRKLRDFGCLPYPMPLIRNDETRGFQRWILTHYGDKVPWETWKKAECREYKLRWEERTPLPLFEDQLCSI